MSGKGDKRRPRIVDRKTFDANWDRTFGDIALFGHAAVEASRCDTCGDFLLDIGGCASCAERADRKPWKIDVGGL